MALPPHIFWREPSLLSNPSRACRELLGWLYDLVARSARSAGKPYLSGNFAPVPDELAVEGLEVVEGRIPEGLEGCYVRNGPNPLLKPVAGYHW